MNDLQKAKILFTALLNGKSHSSPHYEIYEKAFLNSILSSEEIKLEIMKGNNEACYILAKTYEIINRNQQDEYNFMLLTLIGSTLGNDKCKNIIDSYPAKYEILEPTVNNFICNYVGRSDITFDDAILSAASIPDTLETPIDLFGNSTSRGNLYVDPVLESSRTLLYAAVRVFRPRVLSTRGFWVLLGFIGLQNNKTPWVLLC